MGERVGQEPTGGIPRGTGQVNDRCEQAKLSRQPQAGRAGRRGSSWRSPGHSSPGDGWRDRAESGLRDGPDLYPDLYIHNFLVAQHVLTPRFTPTGLARLTASGREADRDAVSEGVFST